MRLSSGRQHPRGTECFFAHAQLQLIAGTMMERPQRRLVTASRSTAASKKGIREELLACVCEFELAPRARYPPRARSRLRMYIEAPRARASSCRLNARLGTAISSPSHHTSRASGETVIPPPLRLAPLPCASGSSASGPWTGRRCMSASASGTKCFRHRSSCRSICCKSVRRSDGAWVQVTHPP